MFKTVRPRPAQATFSLETTPASLFPITDLCLSFCYSLPKPGLIAEAKETIPEMQMCKEAAELERKFPLLPASDMYADVLYEFF